MSEDLELLNWHLEKIKNSQYFYEIDDVFESLNLSRQDRSYMIIMKNVNNGDTNKGNWCYLKGLFKFFKIKILKYDIGEYVVKRDWADEYYFRDENDQEKLKVIYIIYDLEEK